MKILRIKKGYTQKELAIIVGISRSYVSRIENGDISGLTIGKLIIIAKALNVSPMELLEKLLN